LSQVIDMAVDQRMSWRIEFTCARKTFMLHLVFFAFGDLLISLMIRTLFLGQLEVWVASTSKVLEDMISYHHLLFNITHAYTENINLIPRVAFPRVVFGFALIKELEVRLTYRI